MNVWYDGDAPGDVYAYLCDGATSVPAGSEDIDFYLKTGVTISGRVTDLAGNGIYSAIFLYTAQCGGQLLPWSLSDTEGYYTVTGLPPGESFYITTSYFNQPPYLLPHYVNEWYDDVGIGGCYGATPVLAPSSGINFELDVDSDEDGMPDEWETTYFDDLTHDGTIDTDTDGLSDLQEYQNGTDPTDPDTDDDGMPDGWEVQYGLNPNDNSDIGIDSDGDALTNLQEYQNGTDPNDADCDDDGLSDGDEINNGTNPNDSDTDNDGMPDGWEVQYGLNPRVNDASTDPDGDTLTNLKEYQHSTYPNDSDTDDDAMPDGWEVQYSLDPLVNDASADPDHDGYTNLQEYREGGDPNNSATPFPWELFMPAIMK
jgi:hypothetical protein